MPTTLPLLRQADGFEGLTPIRLHLGAGEAAIPHRPHVANRWSSLHPSAVGAARARIGRTVLGAAGSIIGIVRGSTFHEAEVESRWEAAPAVVLVIGFQSLLAIVSQRNGWKLWGLPWWVWLLPVVPEVVLLLPLALQRPRRRLEQLGHRRTVALALVAVVSVANALALVALVGSILGGHENNGAELLLKGAAVWGTNVVVFSLWFWGLDRGGPITRCEPNSPPPDFQFPQLENPQLAEPGWQPRLVDYIYVSFTNSIAFSPTDAMPLTRWAKLLMLAGSAVSAVTVLLVAARSVNILT